MCDYRLAEPPVWTRYDPAGILSKENTLDWVRRFYAGMAEGTQPPRGPQSPPPGPGGLATTLEAAMVEMLGCTPKGNGWNNRITQASER